MVAAGQTILPNERVYSDNGQYFLTLQSDGNLVFYGPSGAIWNTKTAGSGASRAVMQPDGNFVVYRIDNSVVFVVRTGRVSSFLNIQDDGNLVFYRLLPIWNSHTNDSSSIQSSTAKIFYPNTKIFPGQVFSNGQYQLIFQTDGDLVLYKDGGRAIWSSGTAGRGATELWMQNDGNFVIYANGRPIWLTSTQGNSNAFFAFQPDGNLVIYRSEAVWDWKNGFLNQAPATGKMWGPVPFTIFTW